MIKLRILAAVPLHFHYPAVEQRFCFIKKESGNPLQTLIFGLEIINRAGKKRQDDIDKLPDSFIQIDYFVAFTYCSNSANNILAADDFRSRGVITFLEE